MHIGQIEKNLTELVKNISKESFIYDLLLAYGTPKTTVTLLKKGNRNLSKQEEQIILKRKLFFQETSDQDLHNLIDTLKSDETTYRHNPRFIVVTDYKTLLAVDIKTNDTLDIKIEDINKHPFFFGPWAKIEKNTHHNEQEADVKAAEKMAKIYDEILKDNNIKTAQDLHGLNIFLSRLLFCFFAEDTGIFEGENIFTSYVSASSEDGSDLNDYLNKLFKVLNTGDRSQYPDYLSKFPYVNGGLFGDEYFAPTFSLKARRMIIECGELDWAAINPDIFGSMIQAVVHPDQRGGMGMHYTSVPNIMKVIEPLFLNELREEFDKAYDDKIKLEKLLGRLTKLRIFDPACGSGNFLIIAYKELRELEMEIWIRRCELAHMDHSSAKSFIRLNQFYGIELDDFAHEVAILSLWLTEHQMNVKFKEIFGQANPTLPLKEGGNIVHGNATRLKWEDICPKDKNAEIYILGNPPFDGSSEAESELRRDIAHSFTDIKFRNFDYVACWFYNASKYINNTNFCYAFVSTNSICQGIHSSKFWPLVFDFHQKITFAYEPFIWTNNAKNNAKVICVIVGVTTADTKRKTLLYKDSLSLSVNNIDAYLSASRNMVISAHSNNNALHDYPAAERIGFIDKSMDFIFSEDKYKNLIKNTLTLKKFFRKIVGSKELLQGEVRYCLYVTDDNLQEALDNDLMSDIFERVKTTRGNDRFYYRFCKKDIPINSSLIVIPRMCSSNREYIPIGFLSGNFAFNDQVQIIQNPSTDIFGLISSKLHMTWAKKFAGRLKGDFRYSNTLCYNTFPIPDLTEKQKETITTHVYNVLEERENHSEKTMAELYDPDKMPDGLREAHHHLDLAVERCYRSKPFTSDEERLEYLFKLYETMTAKEKSGELL